jgi:hypothetical protein
MSVALLLNRIDGIPFNIVKEGKDNMADGDDDDEKLIFKTNCMLGPSYYPLTK